MVGDTMKRNMAIPNVSADSENRENSLQSLRSGPSSSDQGLLDTTAPDSAILPLSSSDENTLSGGVQKRVTVERAPGEQIGMKIRSEHGVKGVRISEVTPNGPCHRTGGVEVGDIIVSINDRPMLDLQHKQVFQALKSCGATFQLVVSGPAPAAAAEPPSRWRTFSCQKHVTTRPQNSSDSDYYYFISDEEFDFMKDAGLFDTSRNMAGFSYGSFYATCLQQPAHTSLSSSETLFPRTSLAIYRCTVRLSGDENLGVEFTPKQDILAPVVHTVIPQGVVHSQCEIEAGDVVFVILDGKISDPRPHVASPRSSALLRDELSLFVIRENPTNTGQGVPARSPPPAPAVATQPAHVQDSSSHAKASHETVAMPAAASESNADEYVRFSAPNSAAAIIESVANTAAATVPDVDLSASSTASQIAAAMLLEPFPSAAALRSDAQTHSSPLTLAAAQANPVDPPEALAAKGSASSAEESTEQRQEVIAAHLTEYRSGKQPAAQCLASNESLVADKATHMDTRLNNNADSSSESDVVTLRQEANDEEIAELHAQIAGLESKLEKRSSDLWIQSKHVSALQEALDTSLVPSEGNEAEFDDSRCWTLRFIPSAQQSLISLCARSSAKRACLLAKE